MDIVTISAKIKKISERHFKNILIKIPQVIKESFNKYQIELIEYDPILPHTVGIFIVDENENDILRETVDMKNPFSFPNAFQKLYNSLQTLEKGATR